MIPNDGDRARARRLIRLLLRLEPHETDDTMVEGLACELASMRFELVTAVQPATAESNPPETKS